jgi:hypothetical protein
MHIFQIKQDNSDKDTYIEVYLKKNTHSIAVVADVVQNHRIIDSKILISIGENGVLSRYPGISTYFGFTTHEDGKVKFSDEG